MSATLSVLLAGLGAAAFVGAVRELLAGAPDVGGGIRSALAAMAAVSATGRLPTDGERRRLALLGSGLVGCLALLLTGFGATTLLAALAPAGVGALIGRGHARYRRAVEAAIPSIADALADGLASGGSLRRAVAEAAAAAEGPAGVELTRVRADLAVGASPTLALEALAARVGSERVTALIGALLSQERAGGDTAALLRAQAEAARGRRRAEDEARAATAQARLTGGMVVAMPLVAIALVELAAPGFAASLLGEPLAALLIAVAVALQLAGYLLIKRIGRVGA